MKKILLFSRDPGGANVVASLISSLKEKEYEVKLFGKDYALIKYEQFGYSGMNIMNSLKEITLESIKNFLIEEKPDFIITGTSADDFTEKYLWKCSEELEIPSFAILDQWMNYGIRFSRFNLSQIEEYNLRKIHDYLPTRILVMDEYAKEQMINEGIEAYKVEVTGQPYFEYLIKKKKLISAEDILKYKQSVGCLDSDIIIIFAAEAINRTYLDDSKAEEIIGYSDKSILNEIYKCVKEISPKSDKNIKIIIRPHPKDDINIYTEFVLRKEERGFQVLIDKNTDGVLVINAADIVCGMSSMFLLESAIMRKPIISVQIGLKEENPFILSQIGQIETIVTSAKLKNVFEDFILKKHYGRYNLQFKYEGIKKILNLMEEFLWEN